VGRAQNQPEAELLQGLLLEEGIPSMTRRAPGFDVPDFLAAGPRDILVPESGMEAAREALGASPSPPGERSDAGADADADAGEDPPGRR
jgi:hypothetical protein